MTNVPDRAERILRSVLRLLPKHRRSLGDAVLAESSSVPAESRRAWLLGGLWFVLREGVLPRMCYLLGLFGSVAVLVVVDRSPSDFANQAALLVLLGVSTVLGFAAPRKAWLSALVIGISICVEHLLAETVGPGLPYQTHPAGVAGALSLLVLLVPAAVGAALGVGASRLARSGSKGRTAG